MKKNLLYDLAFLLLAVTFIILKIPYLQLPYFWDEAWVYGPAVRTMAESIPSLAPDSIPSELGRGHPLLFHFLGSTWLKIFGNSVTSSHCFSLFTSLLFLTLIYSSIKIIINQETGLIMTLLITVQPVFFAQSVLLLPEVMLALFLFGSITFYNRNNYPMYFIFASCAILTKESAIVLFATLSLIEIIFPPEKIISAVIKRIIRINLPATLWIAFIFWQKLIHGWYFFPEHMGSISNDLATFLNKLENYFSYIFLYQGRNILSAALIIAIIIHFFKGPSFKKNEKQLLLVISMFTIIFLVFSSMNFYSGRYVVLLIVFHCIITSWMILRVNGKAYLKYLLLLVCFISGAWNVYDYKGINDHSRGYADAVKCSKEAIDFTSSLPDDKSKKIYSTFLIYHALQNSGAGYVTKEQEMKNVSNESYAEADLIILTNFEEAEPFSYDDPGKNNLEIIFHCQRNNAGVKVCTRHDQKQNQ